MYSKKCTVQETCLFIYELFSDKYTNNTRRRKKLTDYKGFCEVTRTMNQYITEQNILVQMVFTNRSRP